MLRSVQPLIDGRARCAGRRHDALPSHEFETFQSCLGQRWNIGRRGNTFRARDAVDRELAVVDLLQRRLQVDHHERDTSGGNVEHRRNAAR